LGYEVQDLQRWTESAFDYLKQDDYFIPFDNVTMVNELGPYHGMAGTIAKVAAATSTRPVCCYLCEYGW
jgi:alpha-galactosidase